MSKIKFNGTVGINTSGCLCRPNIQQNSIEGNTGTGIQVSVGNMPKVTPLARSR